MRALPVWLLLLIAFSYSGIGLARADGADWLVGHWNGHNAKLMDTRTFAMDVQAVNSDQSFSLQWSLNGNTFPAKGTVDKNAVNIVLGNGTKIALFRASDGSLAGSTTTKDGAPGINLVFAKGIPGAAPAVQASGSGQGCDYKGLSTVGVAPTLHANDGDEVAMRLGRFKCVNGRLMREN